MLSSSGEGGGVLRNIIAPVVILTNETMLDASWELAFVNHPVITREQVGQASAALVEPTPSHTNCHLKV